MGAEEQQEQQQINLKVAALDLEVKALKESQKDMALTLNSIQNELKDKSVRDAETHGIIKNIENIVSLLQAQMQTMSDVILKTALGTNVDADKVFYRKVIIVCFSALVTISLAALGIKTLIKVPI